MITEISVLSDFDSAQLDQLEERIGAGLSSFIEVGEALSAIRERKLYRQTHGTFEDYCVSRWKMKRAHAYRLMDAAAALSPIGDKSSITTESQARELARVEPAQRQAVVEKAIQATGGKITAAALKEAAKPTPTIEFEPVVEMPPQRRRARSEFVMGDWQDHARTVLRMTLDSVPAADKRAAINFLSKLIGEL